MRSLPKLIRRFVSIMILSSFLLIVLNIVLLIVFTARQMPNAGPWKTAEEAADNLFQDENGYFLSEATALELKESDIWAIFIDNGTMQVVWQTDNLPGTVPMSYSISEIARLTRGYIDGYPTFTGLAENGLMVLGYPKDSFWKHMWPSWDYQLIANLPQTVLAVLACNVVLIFVIYVTANSKMLKSIEPIVNAIQSLPRGESVYVPERGLLSELAVSINMTSEILQSQSRQLRRKEYARANWIAGVSHDIRTPLSMVMGYACQLKDDAGLTEEERQKAVVIAKQSGRIRDLINDLNLASKLEYNMQPVNPKRENLVAIVRQVVVDYMNMDIDDRHPIEWETEEALTICMADVDRDLIRRAVGNLIQNCISHNGQGCHIYVSVMAENSKCVIVVADDGTGADDGQIERLNNAPHYMVCDENTTKQRHGLGLLIVKQIIAVHKGTVMIGKSPLGGFSVTLTLPMD